MSERNRVRLALLNMCLDLVPPIVREDVLVRPELQQSFPIKLDAVMSLGNGVSFQRSALFAAIKVAESRKGGVAKIADVDGRDWELRAEDQDNDPVVVLTFGERVVRTRPLALMSTLRVVRLKAFTNECRRVNLPGVAITRWERVLRKRRLKDDEFAEVLGDLRNTPVSVAETISSRLARGSISVEDIVPRSKEYYLRLIGRRTGQTDIRTYAAEVLPEHFGALLRWHPLKGIQQALLLASHSIVVDAIANQMGNDIDLATLASWAQSTDPFSCGAALEIGLLSTRRSPGIDSSIKSLAEKFVADVGGAGGVSLDVASAAFAMIDGEMSKARVMVEEPPFVRRMAALAQAALFTRCMLSENTDSSGHGIVRWMKGVRTNEHLVQTLVDLRLEPRWLAEFATGDQLRNEVCGRVLSVAKNCETTTREIGLEGLLISDGANSLRSHLSLLSTILPGPLEGGIESVMNVPADAMEKLRDALRGEDQPVGALNVVGTYAVLCELPRDIAGLAAEMLRLLEYRVDNLEGNNIAACLLGLAAAAAIGRSHDLADEVIIASRVARQRSPDRIDMTSVFEIGVVACASRSNVDDWRKAVGSAVGALAFGDLNSAEAGELYACVVALCECDPFLWVACSPALAAIEAIQAGHLLN